MCKWPEKVRLLTHDGLMLTLSFRVDGYEGGAKHLDLRQQTEALSEVQATKTTCEAMWKDVDVNLA